MPKMKIAIQKPQYLAAKDPVVGAEEETERERKPFFFRLLLVATYMLSGLAIWYVYQRYSAHS